jgi:predicted Rossmann-fold nucleotide-binding protein
MYIVNQSLLENMNTAYPTIDTQISPEGHLEILSKLEVSKLLDTSHGGLYQIFRKCCLAVMNSGNVTDDGNELLQRYPNFEITIILRERGIKLNVISAPAIAFVDGIMIKGIREHLFSVLRDIIYASEEILENPNFDLSTTDGVTDSVFHILRNAGVLKSSLNPNLVVCWGGHSINTTEYNYTKRVGYELGLRGLDICTGCGPGAMKGPMKGATIGHAKQRIENGRYLGVTEPSIIAAESPNPIVNNLVILPDIEKRLEAFVRIGHGVVVFPGGAGTAEEILYILGILLHPDNQEMPFPLIFTGPESSSVYFEQVHQFIGATLGDKAQSKYKIIVDNPALVAQEMAFGIAQVREYRKRKGDAYYFNWLLKIDQEFQKPFAPTHSNMRGLSLHKEQPVHLLAANLRRAFSGVVAGNVKQEGLTAIAQFGCFEIQGDQSIMGPMDALLGSFVEQQRMKLPGKTYIPCYVVFK